MNISESLNFKGTKGYITKKKKKGKGDWCKKKEVHWCLGVYVCINVPFHIQAVYVFYDKISGCDKSSI